ncbi:MAG TPA: hypothetical protein PLH90_02060, partial [Candidatus Paceibacterota bacterium]|nr:hypothetical protein [Candidatus Paceibacterota bacterium]
SGLSQGFLGLFGMGEDGTVQAEGESQVEGEAKESLGVEGQKLPLWEEGEIKEVDGRKFSRSKASPVDRYIERDRKRDIEGINKSRERQGVSTKPYQPFIDENGFVIREEYENGKEKRIPYDEFNTLYSDYNKKPDSSSDMSRVYEKRGKLREYGGGRIERDGKVSTLEGHQRKPNLDASGGGIIEKDGVKMPIEDYRRNADEGMRGSVTLNGETVGLTYGGEKLRKKPSPETSLVPPIIKTPDIVASNSSKTQVDFSEMVKTNDNLAQAIIMLANKRIEMPPVIVASGGNSEDDVLSAFGRSLEGGVMS